MGKLSHGFVGGVIAGVVVLSAPLPARAEEQASWEEQYDAMAGYPTVDRHNEHDLYDGTGERRPTHPYDPTQGTVEQAVGAYGAGTLMQADRFGLEGDGFVKLFRPRQRWFGTFDLVTIIEQAAAKVRAAFPVGERLQIGDTAAEKGGFISGHASHQNGLDADIAYFRRSHQEQDPQDTRGFLEVFVAKEVVTKNFDVERNWAFIKNVVDTNRINRIFMDPAIKREFCRFVVRNGAKSTEEMAKYLRPLRPWPNHDDHMHVRVTCPDKSPRCEVQAEPPVGSGCNEVDFDRP